MTVTHDKIAELRALAEAARDAQAEWHADVCAATTIRFHDALGELRHAIREPATILALMDRVIPELPDGWGITRVDLCVGGPIKPGEWRRHFCVVGPTPNAAVAAAVAKIGEPT